MASITIFMTEDTISRKHLLSEIDELMQSPWFNNGKDDKTWRHYGYVERKEAVEIVRDLCVKVCPSIATKPVECEDVVSRQALRVQFDHLNDVYEGMSEEEEHEAYIYGQIIWAIDNAPSITPKQRWIPVDYDSYPETYPKAFQDVWITDAYGEVYHKAYDGARKIKAWMPYVIPEPYKEGESE